MFQFHDLIDFNSLAEFIRPVIEFSHNGTLAPAPEFTHGRVVISDDRSKKQKQSKESGVKMKKFNLESIKNELFKEVFGVSVDIATGKQVIELNDGAVSYDGGVVTVNPMSMTVEMPCFAQLTPKENIKVGDIYLSKNGVLSFVEKVNAKSLGLINADGEKTTVSSVVNKVLNKTGYMIVSQNNLSFDGGSGGFNPMMLALMSDDGGSGKSSMMKKIMLMNAMGGGQGQNPMMMAMMMGDGDMDKETLMLMMMMQNNQPQA